MNRVLVAAVVLSILFILASASRDTLLSTDLQQLQIGGSVP
jgi:hypothetical protein